MPRGSLTVEDVLTLLTAAPPYLVTITGGLSPAQACASASPGEWSANDVLAHLRSCADVWGGCMARIIHEDGPTIRAINPRTWITQTDYPEQEFHPSLRAYAAQRTELLGLLMALPEAGWSRVATVTGAGKLLRLTVVSYAERMALHERPHLKQIARTISALRGS